MDTAPTPSPPVRRLRPGIDVPLETRPIVVFGSNGCGTRTLAGVWFDRLARGEFSHLKLLGLDAETPQRLRRYFNDLQHGQWPAPEPDRPEMRFRLSHDDNVIHVVCDVVVRPYPTLETLSVALADRWVREASALVLLVDPLWLAAVDEGACPEAWQQFLATVDSLRAALGRLESRRLAPRVMVVVTKADLWRGRLAGRRDRLLGRLKRVVYPLRRSVRHFRLGSLSATGESNLPDDAQGRPVPPLPLNPMNLDLPFRWHASTYLQEKLRKWKVIGIVLALAAAVGLALAYRHDAASYRTLHDFWVSHQEPPHESEVLRRCQEYLRRHPLGRFRQAVRALMREVQSRREDRDLLEVLRWGQSHPADFGGLRQRYQEYLHRYPYSRHAAACRQAIEQTYVDEEQADYQRIDRAVLLGESPIEEIQKLAQAYLRKWPAGHPHARHREEVMTRMKLAQERSDATRWKLIEAHRRENPGALEEILANYRRYRDDALAGRVGAQHVAEAERIIAQTLEAIVARDYERVLRSVQWQRYTQEKIRELTAFIDRYPHHALASQARQQIEALRLQPGQETWEKLVAFRHQFPESLEAILERYTSYAAQYREYAADSPVVREHLREAEAYAAWYRHLSSPQTYAMTLVRGEALSAVTDADYYVKVLVNGEVIFNSAESDPVHEDDPRPVWNLTFPVIWRLGDTVEVEVWEQDGWPDADDPVAKIVAGPLASVEAGVLHLRTRLPLAALAGTHEACWGNPQERFRLVLKTDFPDFPAWLARYLPSAGGTTQPASRPREP